MKRFLILALILCLAGCGAGPETPADEGWRFSWGDVTIAMHADAGPILSALGEPRTYTEEASCAFDGLDKTYYYGSFYMTTYPAEDRDRVYSLWFADDSAATEEGIRIGCTQAEVDAVYGADSFNGVNAYTLTRGESELTIILTDGVVTSVQYQAVIR